MCGHRPVGLACSETSFSLCGKSEHNRGEELPATPLHAFLFREPMGSCYAPTKYWRWVIAQQHTPGMDQSFFAFVFDKDCGCRCVISYILMIVIISSKINNTTAKIRGIFIFVVLLPYSRIHPSTLLLYGCCGSFQLRPVIVMNNGERRAMLRLICLFPVVPMRRRSRTGQDYLVTPVFPALLSLFVPFFQYLPDSFKKPF